MAEQPGGGDADGVIAHSFVVRALLERDSLDSRPRWHGFVTDAQTGARGAWRVPSEVAQFIEVALAAHARADVGGARLRGIEMAGPTLTDVVTGMLALLGQHLPATPPAPPLPVSNVTLERAAERLVGLGNQAGAEPTGALGSRTLRGGRLQATVRFQVWADSPAGVDDALRAVHTDLLDDVDHLRTLGFLRLKATGTTLAEHVPSIPGWRKAASFDVLYEYRYADADDAASLVARVMVTSDLEQPGSAASEFGEVTDELVRWDQEAAPPLVVRGPAAVRGISALAFLPGPALGGTVTIRRSSGIGGPVTSFPDLDAFLAATTGATPAAADAEVTAAPAAVLAALGPAVPGPELGDWDANGTADAYTGFARRLDQPLLLASSADRFEIRYAPPPGPATGLDQTAVTYLRVNPP